LPSTASSPRKAYRGCATCCRCSTPALAFLPELARQTLLLIAQLIEALTLQIRKIETELLAWQ
jgi:hypothetical protein